MPPAGRRQHLFEIRIPHPLPKTGGGCFFLGGVCPPARRRQHHNLIDFLLWYPKFPVRIGSRNFDHCHSFHSLFPPPAAVVSLPLILCHEVRIRRRVVRIGEIMPRGRSMSAPTVSPGVRWRRGGFRDGRPVPYGKDGRLGGFAGGAVVDGRLCCDNPSVCPFGQTPPFTQGRQGALPRQRKDLGAEEDGGFAGDQ